MEDSLEQRHAGSIAATAAVFASALENGDANAASSLYTEDARLLPPSVEPLEGRESIEAFWQAGIEAGVSTVELETLGLEMEHAVAYETGRYTLRLKPSEGGPLVEKGKYVLVHRRGEDGSWRRAVEMFSPDAPTVRA
jgi:ketosteroid isomerase-like protein